MDLSLLPLISIIIEKNNNEQASTFLNLMNLLYAYILIHLYYRQWISHRDDPSWPTKSVWDIRSHHTFTKMKCIGFKGSVIKWFQLYLSNGKLFVTLENVFSDAGLTKCAAPQGSILGVLLFLIHINDLPQALNETRSYLYADNTCFLYQDKDVEKIDKVLTKEFLSLCEWFIDNKLSIHFGDDRTKTIFFLSNEMNTKTKQHHHITRWIQAFKY